MISYLSMFAGSLLGIVMLHHCEILATLWLTSLLLNGVPADPPPAQIRASACYFREEIDRAWKLRVVGAVPSLAGYYWILYDAQGRTLLRRQIPSGRYSSDNPLTIDFPPDGVTGDYKLMILATQADWFGLSMPLSDLPEVYLGDYFTVGGPGHAPVYFRAPRGVSAMDLTAYKGTARVFDGADQIADCMAQGRQVSSAGHYRQEFPLSAGRTYRIESESFYLASTSRLFVTFEPDSWFEPDERLDAIHWWDLP